MDTLHDWLSLPYPNSFMHKEKTRTFFFMGGSHGCSVGPTRRGITPYSMKWGTRRLGHVHMGARLNCS
jgi:hypothetical protein